MILSIVTKYRLIVISLLLLLSPVAWRNRVTVQDPPAVATSTVVINPAAKSHKLKGVGVHVFDADYHSPKFTSALTTTLRLKYLRVPFGPEWNKLSNEPPDCNNFDEDYSSMLAFISDNFNSDHPDRLTNAVSTSNIAQNLGIKVILVNWRAHPKWITDDEFKELRDIYVDDYACFVVGIVEFLTNKGVKISYLEPTNEPSDITDTKIPPERYNTFVKTLRKYLDKRELAEVKILGPGLAYLNHDDACNFYLEALDDDGVDTLSKWAAHAWDPEFATGKPEKDTLRMKWEEFQKCIKKREQPEQPKLIFITEYACVNDPGNAICAVENTLTLLDQGANVVVYWYLREQGWDPNQANRERALLTENYEEKPTFTALTSVLPFISGDEVWVLETQIEGRITAASFYKADDEAQIIVALVNNYPEPENVLIDINGASTVEMIDAVLYEGETNTIKDPAPVQCQAARCQLTLPPNTVTTLIFRRYWAQYVPTIILSH